MRRVLMVSRFFPPSYSAGGRRAFHFARHLPAYGWEPVVVTSALAPGEAPDPSFADRVAGIEVHPTYYPEDLVRQLPSQTSGYGPKKASPAQSFGRRPRTPWGLLSWYLRQPVSPFWRHRERITSGLVESIEALKPEIIWATSAPYEMLPCAVAAGQRTGVPVVLDLRDPWTRNVLQQDKPRRVQEIEARVERESLEQAAAVVVVTAGMEAMYREDHPYLAGRLHCVRNSFDGEAMEPVGPSPDAPVTLLHFGNCYGDFRLGAYLEGMARLVRRGGVSKDQLRLRLLGRPAAKDVEDAKRLGMESCFELHAFVPYQEGLELLAQADLCLLADFGADSYNLPSKFFDYVRAGRPIACLATQGELKAEIEAHGLGVALDPADPAAMDSLLERVVHAHGEGGLKARPLAAADPFSARHTSRSLAALFDGVMAPGAKPA